MTDVPGGDIAADADKIARGGGEAERVRVFLFILFFSSSDPTCDWKSL